MFDRDLNGDISVTEMELACGEIGRERKAVIKSLKVLDSVVGKLNGKLLSTLASDAMLIFLQIALRSLLRLSSLSYFLLSFQSPQQVGFLGKSKMTNVSNRSRRLDFR